MNDSGTSIMPSGHCPFCSGAGGYVYHGGRCPQVKAIEYHPNGRVKRIEFIGARIAGLHQGSIEVALDFDTAMGLVDRTLQGPRMTDWEREPEEL